MVTSHETSLKDITECQAFRDSDGHLRHRTWIVCPKCKEGRWVQQTYKPNCFTRLCKKCRSRANLPHNRGDANPRWKGGRHKTQSGYIAVWISPDDFFYPMADHHGYIREHRLIMAKYLNRCLLPWELVHHKGTRYALESKENKSDNRIENLELIKGTGKHNALTRMSREIRILQERVTLLEAENILLKQSTNKQYKAVIAK